jgi:hypothetical protein
MKAALVLVFLGGVLLGRISMSWQIGRSFVLIARDKYRTARSVTHARY